MRCGQQNQTPVSSFRKRRCRGLSVKSENSIARLNRCSACRAPLDCLNPYCDLRKDPSNWDEILVCRMEANSFVHSIKQRDRSIVGGVPVQSLTLIDHDY